jgi:DNA-binding NtrC family response regulator
VSVVPDRPVVAVINTSEEVVDLLTRALEIKGFWPAVGRVIDFKTGRQDVNTFLKDTDPRVVVWDIAIPYEENWEFFKRVQASAAAQGRRFILTTTNKRALESFVGPTPAHEIIGKPYDIDELIDAVGRAMQP